MQVNVAFLGAILLLIVVIYFLRRGFGVIELFTNQNTNTKETEGFVSGSGKVSDIVLTTCPADSTSFINDNGRTICCQGMILDNKCSGKTLCTLSESAEGVPTCNEWFSAWLDERSARRCFPGMPNYFEDKTTGVKGCCAGLRKNDGSAPATVDAKKCIIYNSQKDENEKEDSCTNMKLFDSVKCFTRDVPGTKKARDRGFITCSYTLNDGPMSMPRTCYTDQSLEKYFDNIAKEVWKGISDWRAFLNEILRIDEKLLFCSVQQKVYIDKTHTRDQVKNIQLFGTGPVENPSDYVIFGSDKVEMTVNKIITLPNFSKAYLFDNGNWVLGVEEGNKSSRWAVTKLDNFDGKKWSSYNDSTGSYSVKKK